LDILHPFYLSKRLVNLPISYLLPKEYSHNQHSKIKDKLNYVMLEKAEK
jgi:hypothetical protein